MKDPVLVLGWVWAVYLAARLLAEGIDRVFMPRLIGAPSLPREAVTGKGPRRGRKWTPLPAVLWLAGEVCIAVIVVGVVWWLVRGTSANLVPVLVSATPVDVRRVAVAAILGWSLFVINVPFAWRLVGRLLPADSKKAAGGVDPERMGATIGVLERLLVIVLVPSGGAPAVGFVVAAKTLARFKELNKKRFAERYLLGTMASVTIALVSALAAQWIWSLQV